MKFSKLSAAASRDVRRRVQIRLHFAPHLVVLEGQHHEGKRTMFGTANAKVVTLQKDPATMSDRELFDHIQYLKREVAKRADERANFPLETLTDEARETIARIAASDQEQLAILLPIEEELRRMFGMQ